MESMLYTELQTFLVHVQISSCIDYRRLATVTASFGTNAYNAQAPKIYSNIFKTALSLG